MKINAYLSRVVEYKQGFSKCKNREEAEAFMTEFYKGISIPFDIPNYSPADVIADSVSGDLIKCYMGLGWSTVRRFKLGEPKTFREYYDEIIALGKKVDRTRVLQSLVINEQLDVSQTELMITEYFALALLGLQFLDPEDGSDLNSVERRLRLSVIEKTGCRDIFRMVWDVVCKFKPYIFLINQKVMDSIYATHEEIMKINKRAFEHQDMVEIASIADSIGTTWFMDYVQDTEERLQAPTYETTFAAVMVLVSLVNAGVLDVEFSGAALRVFQNNIMDGIKIDITRYNADENGTYNN